MASYEMLILSLGCVLVAISILAFSIIQRRRKAAENPVDDAQEDNIRERVLAGRAVRGDAPRRPGRNVRARMRAAAGRREEEDGGGGGGEEDDDGEPEPDPLSDDIALPEGKIGAKKRRKLEMKAEKKHQRERELEEREERRQREQEREERRKREEAKEMEERLKQEAEEKALKEEEEKRELEEYLKLKAAFEVEEEGFDQDDTMEESHKFQEFLNYIQEQKVVVLEDLASHFKLKTQDAINRVQDLLAQETLIGVIDDRGKLIHITREELESVAQFIKQRGRVSISELAECSNSLIKLQVDLPSS